MDDIEETTENQPEVGHKIREHTARFRVAAGDSKAIAIRVGSILDHIETVGLDLPIFLDAVCWGNENLLVHMKGKRERSALVNSCELPQILERLQKRSRRASSVLKSHALSIIKAAVDTEMDSVVSELTAVDDDLGEEMLLSITQQEMLNRIKPAAGTLWEILDSSTTRKGKSRNKHPHNPQKIVSFVISQLAFCRNRRANIFQKFLSLYLKGCGLATRAFDTLSSLGVTTSQKWAFTGIDHLVQSAQQKYTLDVQTRLFILSHDNVNIPFRVYEPSATRQSHFDNGTATTLYTFPQTVGMTLDAATFRESCRAGRERPIDGGTVLTVNSDANLRTKPRFIHWILRFLLEAPEFDLSHYKYRDSEILQPPPPVNQLQWGDAHKTTQYMLPTAHIDESTYEGNDEIVAAMLKCIGFSSTEELKRVGQERVVVWVGDQLTVSRLRGLQNLRLHDWNTFERMAWMVPMFGWFHLQMAFANSLHAQYYGPKAALGFSHAFDILQRKGLHSTSTQGTFHHTFEGALFVVGAARFRDVWKQVAGVENLEELQRKQPAELHDLAVEIWESYGSTGATVKLGNSEADEDADADELLSITIRFNRDLLDYFELDEAIKVGDVGRMEDMLPRLLFRFIGGGNNKYVVEVLELLQGLHREWTEEVRDYVRRYCWLVNFTGHQNGFCPIDLAQERHDSYQQLKNPQHTFASFGPGITGGYIAKISAAIPSFRKLKDHFEHEWNSYSRYQKHTHPDYQDDIKRLERTYTAAKLHRRVPGRKLSENLKYTDYIHEGSKAVNSGKPIPNWQARRKRDVSDKEMWEGDNDDTLD
ncbi:hypothetical protein BJ322DRAFT_1000129 [Thelephora terrestris]|uniref:DUF6589 domain-containing protein n=1 Tax=Thelephora terrestris TaxID=56493 RepID=A0A9P6HN42_9AGAM|nr:hypothetical protein BJ322DRAFT_1000129 [Thelephora terrestris]